jgi:hypothetical protein
VNLKYNKLGSFAFYNNKLTWEGGIDRSQTYKEACDERQEQEKGTEEVVMPR